MSRLALSWSGPDGAVLHELPAEETVIGRAEECQLVLPDRSVSRRHARVAAQADGWWIEDLGSRGGTWVNGRPISRPTRLAPGDRVGVGQSVLAVVDAGRAPASAASGPLAPGTSVFRRADELLALGSGPMEAATSGPEALRRRTERLELLNEIHAALGRSVSLEELLELILDRAFRALGPDEGVIVLRDGPGEYRRAAMRRPAGSMGDALLSRTLLEEVVEKRQAAIVCDIAADERFGQAASLRLSGVRSLIAAPLYDEGGPLGMISLDSRAFVRPFTEEDLELLTSLAAVASLRIRNVQLAHEAAERKRLEEELALARSIQIGLLPKSLPAPAGWSLKASSVPSRYVSGDYYLAAERGGSLDVMAVDVSGKGIGAALLTASLEALAAGPLEAALPPEEIFTRVSRLLYQRTPPSKYATAVLARVELASGRTRIANAGHLPVLVARAAGGVESVRATGRPLGLMPDSVYAARELRLEPGDLLALHTDGYVEAADAEGAEFGEERLQELLGGLRDHPLDEIVAAVEGAVTAFVGAEPDGDDRTLLLLRRD